MGVEGSIGRPGAVDEFLGESPRKGKLSWLVVKFFMFIMVKVESNDYNITDQSIILFIKCWLSVG